jgi:hypothetical protein
MFPSHPRSFVQQRSPPLVLLVLLVLYSASCGERKAGAQHTAGATGGPDGAVGADGSIALVASGVTSATAAAASTTGGPASSVGSGGTAPSASTVASGGAAPSASTVASGGTTSTTSGGSGLDFYSPDSSIDFEALDPSTNPGFDPAFQTDPELTQNENENENETYTYVFTRPGDHDLPSDTCTLEFDAAGTPSLLEALQPLQTQLQSCTGLALYLTENADRLRDEDLRTLQILDWPPADGGLDATNLSRLYVYNLRSLQGGRECLPDTGLAWPNTGENCAGTTALGSPGPYMWANGWAEGWVEHIVMDDLQEVAAGTFCNTRFHSISFNGAQSIGLMAFGEQDHGFLTLVYLPSATSIDEHAFRRIQVGLDSATKINLPRVKHIASYAFDDNTDLEYASAPELETMGRNVFNDSGRLISVYMPKLQSMEHGCFGINTTMRVLNLPSLTTIIGDALSNMQELRFLYLPTLEDMGDGALGFSGHLQALYLPELRRLDTGALQGTTSLKRLSLPGDGLVLMNAAFRDASIEELWLTGAQKTLEGSPFESTATLRTIHFGATPPVQQTDNAFSGTSPELVGYYTGNAPTWNSFAFNGNPTATLLAE